MCIEIYTHIYTYIHTHICIYVYTYIYVYTHVCMCIFGHISINRAVSLNSGCTRLGADVCAGKSA